MQELARAWFLEIAFSCVLVAMCVHPEGINNQCHDLVWTMCDWLNKLYGFFLALYDT